MLLFADLCVYPAFRKYGNWREAIHLILPSLVGMAAAVAVIFFISDYVMQKVIGLIILLMVGLQVWKMLKPAAVERLAQAQGFTIFAGLAGGLATMLANAAGPINQLYLLSKNIPKMDLIGIGARFFLIINWVKVPIFAVTDFGAENGAQDSLMSGSTLMISVLSFPMILLGIFVAKKLLTKIPQKVFEWFIIVFAVVASLKLLVF